MGMSGPGTAAGRATVRPRRPSPAAGWRSGGVWLVARERREGGCGERPAPLPAAEGRSPPRASSRRCRALPGVGGRPAQAPSRWERREKLGARPRRPPASPGRWGVGGSGPGCFPKSRGFGLPVGALRPGFSPAKRGNAAAVEAPAARGPSTPRRERQVAERRRERCEGFPVLPWASPWALLQPCPQLEGFFASRAPLRPPLFQAVSSLGGTLVRLAPAQPAAGTPCRCGERGHPGTACVGAVGALVPVRGSR